MNTTEITITTRDFGDIVVNSNSIISFPNGIFAFENLKEFILISPLGDGIYPMWLQNTEESKPCFIVYNPVEIIKDYNPELSKENKSLLNYEEGDQLHYLVIAVVPSDFKNTTVNLKSPIVVNVTKSIASQIILDDDYQIKFPIFNKEDA